MKRDFSWTASAKEYVKVYERAKAQHSPQEKQLVGV
jgi:glycogen synthase